MIQRLLCRISLFILVLAACALPAFAQGACEKLTALQLPNTTITSAAIVPAGNFKLPPGLVPSIDLPAFCRVQAEIKPTADSLIKIEVWMPADGWNGKFEQMGNGGLAGAINLYFLASEMKKGFATAGTDDGHEGQGTDGSWAIGHPEKVKDFGYRAVHETNVAAKKIIAAFYQKPFRYSYFSGCSEGGREALMEAQRFPDDFDGILAGSAAHYWTQLMAAFAWNAQAMNDPAAFLPESKRPAVQKAAVAACGMQDGVSDNFIKDPQRCRFDPSVLLCKGADSDSCLTQPQVDALKKIYAGPKNPVTGKNISAGYEPGTEAEPGFPGITFASYVFGAGPGMSLDSMFSSSFYGAFVFEDPKWKFSQLNFDQDIATTEAKVGSILNASNPDLKAFRKHGGKLIQYHGWNDGSPPPLHSVEYYQSVSAKMGGLARTQEFYRLFMVPGMMHCGAGPGPNTFGNMLDLAPAADADHNIFVSLENWVEKGAAPDRIIATKYNEDSAAKGVAMTRPICPFPKQAKWNGKGETSDAANWTCAAPPLAGTHKASPHAKQ
jgi:Tannase and feruloyl esterase